MPFSLMSNIYSDLLLISSKFSIVLFLYVNFPHIFFVGQVDMESNGKSVDCCGNRISSYSTGLLPISQDFTLYFSTERLSCRSCDMGRARHEWATRFLSSFVPFLSHFHLSFS